MNPFETYYVYKHIDPNTGEVVYVGKGKGGRAWDVTRSRGQSLDHLAWMNSLMQKGYLPCDWVKIVQHSLSDLEARKLETKTIHETGITLFNRQSGERQHQSKLTNKDAIDIFKLREEGLLHKEIATRYGVSRSCISMLLSGKQWRAVTQGVRNDN